MVMVTSGSSVSFDDDEEDDDDDAAAVFSLRDCEERIACDLVVNK